MLPPHLRGSLNLTSAEEAEDRKNEGQKNGTSTRIEVIDLLQHGKIQLDGANWMF